jgi:hypothetical protein
MGGDGKEPDDAPKKRFPRIPRLFKSKRRNSADGSISTASLGDASTERVNLNDALQPTTYVQTSFLLLICRITAGTTSIVDSHDQRIEKDHFQPEASGSNPLGELPTALIDPSSSNSAPASILFVIQSSS